MTKNEKNRAVPMFSRTALTAAAVAGVLMIGACASDDAATADAAPADAAGSAPAAEATTAPASGAFNAGAPRFAVPSVANQSPPSVNTVPTTAPTPASTEEEREEARKGLVADLANARHSEQGGRTQPVVVRPYVATASDQPAPPTAEEPVPGEPLTNRLDTPPPPRPAEAGGAPAKPAAGPAPANKIPSGS
jgi:hypothetical protein